MAHQPTSQALLHLGARSSPKPPKFIPFDPKTREISENILVDSSKDGTNAQTFVISSNPMLQFALDMTETEYSQNGGDDFLRRGEFSLF